MQGGLQYVTVGVRIRPKLENPTNSFHVAERYEPMACFCFSDATLCVSDERLAGDSRKFFFAYDSVFDENSTQEEIYDELASVAVVDVLNGTSATILAYGQTGSGKTHTILGEVPQYFLGEEIITRDAGILLRALQEMLHHRRVNEGKISLVLGFSAVEVYLDEVRDLLSEEKTPVVVQVTFAKDVVRFSGLTCVPVFSLDDVLKAFQRATAKRVQRMTSANDVSSRSHAIFTIEVFQQHVVSKDASLLDLSACISMRDASQLARMEGKTTNSFSQQFFSSTTHQLFGTADAPVLYSKLSLVDLAGSEKVHSANVRDKSFDELIKINSSLTALGNVIHSLYRGSKHVPYRDSKLTILLRDSFATPNSRVVLIVNVSPTLLTVDETLSSLYFADKVKTLKPALCRGDGSEKSIVSEYFLALRKFDELIADVRLAGLVYNFSVPQVVLFLANDLNNVIYDATFHVRKPNSKILTMAFSMMCGAFKNTAEKESLNALRNQELEMENVKDVLCNKFFAKWKKRRGDVLLCIENIYSETSKGEYTKQQKQEEDDCLNEALACYKEARNIRRNVQKEYNIAAARIADAEDLMSSIDKEIQCAENSVEDADIVAIQKKKEIEAETFKQQDETWAWGLEQVIRALALANMRFDLCSLMRENRRLAALLKGYGQAAETVEIEEPSIYDWLRSAVWAMAGNAVVISVRRRKRRSVKKAAASSRFRGSNGHAVPQNSRFLEPQQYEKNRVDSRKRKRLASCYDDATLIDKIMSSMNKGRKVMKFSRNGLLRQWFLYVEGRAGHERLRWSSPKSRLDGGCISLHTVTRILLGRGHEFAEQDSACLGWALVLGERCSAKVIDFLCETVSDLEMWVIGLGEITGRKPVFEEPMKIPPEVLNVCDSLSANDVAFCAEWHIPPAVYTEARQQLSSRLSARSCRGHRLSPGELRNLVKLDIFRASAMWLRFRDEGLVVQPQEKLYCYVDIFTTPQKEQTSSVIAESFAGRAVERFFSEQNRKNRIKNRSYIERREFA